METRRILVIFLLLLTASYAIGNNRWYPDNLSIANLRINSTYVVLLAANSTYHCAIDVFPINNSSISSVSFTLYGAGVDVNSSEAESIGYEDPTDKASWRSPDFNVTSTGQIQCNASVEDQYGTIIALSRTFPVTNELGACGRGPDCTITSATRVYTGQVYRYRNINVTSTGSLFEALTEAVETANGSLYKFYADSDFTLTGPMLLNASSTRADHTGMDAGNLSIQVNGNFTQTGRITGNGVNGAVYANHGYGGGDALGINVTATQWIQAGNLSQIAGNGTDTSTGNPWNGQPGGAVPAIVFTGREWTSTGNLTQIAGKGGKAYGGRGGDGGQDNGLIIYGFWNRTAGSFTSQSGDGGDGNAVGSSVHGLGGFGGDIYVVAYCEGRISYTSTGAISVTGGSAGDAHSDDLTVGRRAGNGVFMYFNGTTFLWNGTAKNITLGHGGDGDNGGAGGSGGNWTSSGNTTYHGITCRDTCTIASLLNLSGGVGGSPSGPAGDNASWEVQYNLVGTGNDFTKLGVSRTTYNLSATAGFPLNSTLGSNGILITADSASFYALENVTLNWTRNDTETTPTTSIFYDLKLWDNQSEAWVYPFVNQTMLPTSNNTANHTNWTLDTNRYSNGSWTAYARERSTFYRYTDWSLVNLTIWVANSTVSGNITSLFPDGTRLASCNYTGKNFYSTGTQWLENQSQNATIYHATVNIIVEDAGVNVTYPATYIQATGLYNATIANTTSSGIHNWWCNATKANWEDALINGTPFSLNNFSVVYPTGVTSIRFLCPFPTFTGAQPFGQTPTVPIMKIVNTLNVSANYSLGLSLQPTGATIYFTNHSNRTGQTALSATANKTICLNVSQGNYTACNIWLWADCVSATVVTGQNVSYLVGQEG